MTVCSPVLCLKDILGMLKKLKFKSCHPRRTSHSTITLCSVEWHIWRWLIFTARVSVVCRCLLLMPYHVSWNYNDAIVSLSLFKLSEKMCQHNSTSLIMIMLDNFPISFMPTPFHILKCKHNLCEDEERLKNKETSWKLKGKFILDILLSLSCFNDPSFECFQDEAKNSSLTLVSMAAKAKRKFIDFSLLILPLTTEIPSE